MSVYSKLLLIETRKLGEFAYRKAIMNKERVQIKKYPFVLPFALFLYHSIRILCVCVHFLQQKLDMVSVVDYLLY